MDWRIPTIDELAILYINKDFIGGFKDDSYYYCYWSSSTKSSDSYYWVLCFNDGSKSLDSSSSNNYARLVRTITE